MQNKYKCILLFLLIEFASSEPPPVQILVYNLWFHEHLADWNTTIPCEVPCRMTYDKSIADTADAYWFHVWDLFYFNEELPPNPRGIPYVGNSLESPSLVAHLANASYMSAFAFTNTYSLHSTLPQLYRNLLSEMFDPLYSIEQKKNEGQGLAVFFASNCDLVHNRRADYVLELMKYITVDSYGKCLNNKPKTDMWKVDVLRKYKFTLAFENSNCKDYVTEKIYHAFLAGSVPVYMGAPNVAAFVPFNHSYIDVNDFKSVKDLADYLLLLDKDDALYSSYLWFKQLSYPPSDTHLSPDAIQTRKYTDISKCDICKRIYEEREAREGTKKVYKKYVRSDETCDVFKGHGIIDPANKHSIDFQVTSPSWEMYIGEVAVVSNTNAHSGSHSLMLTATPSSPLIATHASLSIFERSPRALLVGGWSKTDLLSHTYLYFYIIFEDGTLLPPQKITYNVAEWSYACAVVPTYKPIATMIIMPAIDATSNPEGQNGNAYFDDIVVTSFTETYTPRAYFNSFPPECEVVDAVPTHPPRIERMYLRSRYVPNNDSITLCTHSTASKFQRVVDLSKKWKGPMSVVVWVSSENEANSVAQMWRKNTPFSYFADIHLAYASEVFKYNGDYFREIAISAASSNITFYIDSNFITPTNMHNSLQFAAKHLRVHREALFVVPVFASMTSSILRLTTYDTFVPDNKDDLLSKLAKQEHYNVVTEVANPVVSFKKWIESSEQYYYEDDTVLTREGFFIGTKENIISFYNNSNIPARVQVVSQLFSVQVEKPNTNAHKLDLFSWSMQAQPSRPPKPCLTPVIVSNAPDLSFGRYIFVPLLAPPLIAPLIALYFICRRRKR